jgi:hypothetical protein
MVKSSPIAKIASNFDGDYWSNVGPRRNQSSSSVGGVDCDDDLYESGTSNFTVFIYYFFCVMKCLY